MRELLLKELSKIGIFMENQNYNNNNNKLIKWFYNILKRITQAGLLFYNEKNSKKIVNLTSLLPQSNLSPFHIQFIMYCIENDLPNVLLEYLTFYNLSKSNHNDFLWSYYNNHYLNSTSKLWFKLLIDLKNFDFYQASLTNISLIVQQV